MKIPLNEFEKHIDKTILKRGKDYYQQGLVHEFEEVDFGKYQAIVKGSESYSVTLYVEKEVVTESTCDCPYDLGSVCKHAVATIYYLQQGEAPAAKGKTTKSTTQTKKRKTSAEQVSEVLDKVDVKTLKQFVEKVTQEDKSFRNLFLSTFVTLFAEDSKQFYSKHIKAFIRTASGREGFIDWQDAKQVGNESDHLIQLAQSKIDNKQYQSAIFICTALMDELVKAIQIADDSNDDVGYGIDAASELLKTVAQLPLEEKARKNLFDYCLTSYRTEVFEGWDWHLDMLKIAGYLAKNDEVEDIFLMIDNIKDEKYSSYSMEAAQQLKYEMLLRLERVIEAECYLQQHIGNSSFRKIAIENEVAKKNFNKASQIAIEGIHFDEKEKPGLVIVWYDYLLTIAQVEGKTENVIKYARLLFLESFNPKQDYYQILKECIDANEWRDFVESLILDCRKKGVSCFFLGGIFIKEQWWDRLLDLVKENPELRIIDHFAQHLAKPYAKEIATLYANALMPYMEKNLGRKYYQEACQYLRKIKKLGEVENANAIISVFRQKYPQRRALMEELDKV